MKSEVNKQANQQEIPVTEDITEDKTPSTPEQKVNEAEAKDEEPIDEEPLTVEDELVAARAQIEKLQQALEQAEANRAKFEDQYIRVHAEWENFKKRKGREIADKVRFANEDLMRSLLPVLDDFDRTLKSIEETDNLAAVKDGIALVAKNLKARFEKAGLSAIESLDQVYDYKLHEAITTLALEDEDKKGKVIEEVEKGYKLRDKVIRFSKVVVGE